MLLSLKVAITATVDGSLGLMKGASAILLILWFSDSQVSNSGSVLSTVKSMCLMYISPLVLLKGE